MDLLRHAVEECVEGPGVQASEVQEHLGVALDEGEAFGFSVGHGAVEVSDNEFDGHLVFSRGLFCRGLFNMKE